MIKNTFIITFLLASKLVNAQVVSGQEDSYTETSENIDFIIGEQFIEAEQRNTKFKDI